MNIIGDIAGRFDELMLLLVQMPKDEKIILVGDLVDRGPKSREVVEFAMNTPNVITLKGNHEDMMVDYFLKTGRYDKGIWEMNGGNATLMSYSKDSVSATVPTDHIEWMKNLPLYYKEDDLYVSHCPWPFELGEGAHMFDALWNRYPPSFVPGVFQVFGHNSSMKAYRNFDHIYAMCIDDCSMRRLTGFHWPSKKIYQQDYL